MTRKFIIISACIIFIAVPLLAWLIVGSQYVSNPENKLPDANVQPATKEELLEVITTKPKEDHIHQASDDLRIINIVSYEKIETWWYIVEVKYATFGKENPFTSPMIVAKYHNEAGGILVITDPNEALPYHNISDSSGIPYEVIDKYNAALSESQPEPEAS